MAADGIQRDDIITYREMCDYENVQTLQRGMNYRLNPGYSVVLMSRRPNSPYNDHIHTDGITIEYEGHDVVQRNGESNVKMLDQPASYPSGRLTQNGQFAEAVKEFKTGTRSAELVKVYEKIFDGVWSLKGIFRLVDYKVVNDGNRNVFRFILVLDSGKNLRLSSDIFKPITRMIPSKVKQEVWKRDDGRCVLCGSRENLHFDHILPYSKGGTSLKSDNIQLLCVRHNLAKAAKIE